MKSRLLLAASLLLLSATAPSQETMTVPKATALAYAKQTRCQDGKPGKNYWQNSVAYAIKATVDVKDKMLYGSERMTYFNQSPDTLKTLVIRVYQDLFKKGANRNSLVDIDPRDLTDGVQIGRMTINKKVLSTDEEKKRVRRKGTLMHVKLDDWILPRSKAEIEIDWSFHIPEHTLVRMGTIDSTTVFLGQWYPQVAVYDDLNGWDTHSYNGLAEFYNEVADFDVEITVPQGFIVWATGEPVNIQELIQPSYYATYQKASTSDQIRHLVTEQDLKKGAITTDKHTWKYKASQVSDFAFGLSDHYCWDITSVEVDKQTKRRTVVGVAYNPASKHFDQVVNVARETVRFMSEEMPGVPFPFPYMTVFNGDFGIEYPMITNVGTDPKFDMTVYANSHEIAHSYFPFYVCTNETKNGWLDEGLTVFLPEKIQTQMAPLDEAKRNTAAFSKYAGLEDEPAVITPTHYLDQRIYFYLNYAKTEVALRMLQMELGDSLFKTCLRDFMEHWKYKHPTPNDLFQSFNRCSGQNLNWFWQVWYYQNGGMPDLVIDKVTRVAGGHVQVTVANKGDFPLPIVLSFYNRDKVVKTVTLPARSWLEHPNKPVTVSIETPEEITQVTLGNEYIPDVDRSNNTF